MAMEDLVQIKKTFELNDSTVIDIRPVTIADHLWCKQTFGVEIGEKLMMAENSDPSHALQLIYNQIPYEQRINFKMEEIKSFDEDGVEHVFKVGGWKKLGLLFDPKGGYEDALNAYGIALKEGCPTVGKIDESQKKKKGKN